MSDQPFTIEFPESRKAESEAYHENRKRKKEAIQEKPLEVWYESNDGKVVKKTRGKSGNVTSVYWGTPKEAKAQGIKFKAT